MAHHRMKPKMLIGTENGHLPDLFVFPNTIPFSSLNFTPYSDPASFDQSSMGISSGIAPTSSVVPSATFSNEAASSASPQTTGHIVILTPSQRVVSIPTQERRPHFYFHLFVGLRLTGVKKRWGPSGYNSAQTSASAPGTSNPNPQSTSSTDLPPSSPSRPGAAAPPQETASHSPYKPRDKPQAPVTEREKRAAMLFGGLAAVIHFHQDRVTIG